MMSDSAKTPSDAGVPTGVIVPLITPIDENDGVDDEAFRKLIRRCLDAGVHGVFVGGSAGMGPLLLDDQWQRAMEIAREEVDGPQILMGGVIATSTRRAIEQIRLLEQIRFETMVVTPTFYITLEDEAEMLSHFGSCRDATDMEMVVYNIPSCTGSSIPLATIEDVTRRRWTRSFKESSGDRAYFSRVLDIGNRYGAKVLQGHEPDVEWGLSIGAAGIVPVCANYEPETYVSAWLAAKKSDQELLRRIQQRISGIRDVLLMGEKNWISGIMYGMSSLGIGSGTPMEPLQALGEEDRRLIDALETIDVIV